MSDTGTRTATPTDSWAGVSAVVIKQLGSPSPVAPDQVSAPPELQETQIAEARRRWEARAESELRNMTALLKTMQANETPTPALLDDD
jgi:hypothetical protein